MECQSKEIVKLMSDVLGISGHAAGEKQEAGTGISSTFLVCG